MLSYKFKILLFFFFIILLAIFLQFFTSRGTQDDSTENITNGFAESVQLPSSGRRTVVTDEFFARPKALQTRSLGSGTAESKTKLAELINRLQSEDDSESVDALLEAQDLETMVLISFVQSALNLPGQREIRQEAFELILGYDNSALLPLIEQAFSDSDSDMRLAALEALEGVAGERDELSESEEDSENEFVSSEELTDEEKQQVLTLLETAFNDVDLEVREQAMKTLMQLEYDLQVEGFKLALQSSFDDVRFDAMHVTSTSANQDTIILAMTALNDPDPAIKQSAQENLDFYIGKSFETSEEALKWWQDYKHLFDDDLFLEDLDNLYIIDGEDEE